MAVEAAAAEPTPLERRAGHAARLFWLWFAANSSIVMIAISATLFTFGMSLRQVLVAVVAGVGLSALPLGLGSLAGKWSGQPTMVVSRATFGLVGNILPAVLAVLGRVLWGAVLLWLLAMTTQAVLSPDETGAGTTAIVALAAGAVLAGLVAVLGYGLLHRVQRVLGILSTVLVVATIAVTASHVDIATALRTDDGSWLLAVGGAVLVFSVVGLAWAQSSSDLARYQKSDGSGAANMLWGSFGVIVPTLAILAWGAVLAASDPELADGLARAPLATLVEIVPEGLGLPLLAAAGFGLVAGAIVTMYSGGLALVAAGVRMPRSIATVVAAVLVTVVAVALLLLSGDTRDLVTDLATTLAVPVAAWTGIFASEMMIRLRRFHAPSLLAAGGVYPAVRWVNVVGLVVISAVGLGLVSARLTGFTWEGYLFGLLGAAPDSELARTDLGVLVALVLGLLLPLVSAVPAIRRQERTRGDADAAPDAAVPLVD
jgi:purine-cytosine permease-like protein